MDGWLGFGGWMDRSMDGMAGWMDGWIVPACLDSWIEGLTDEQMGGVW